MQTNFSRNLAPVFFIWGIESFRPDQVIAMCFQMAGLDSCRSSVSMDNKDKVKF
jgi:hypothetical protein